MPSGQEITFIFYTCFLKCFFEGSGAQRVLSNNFLNKFILSISRTIIGIKQGAMAGKGRFTLL